jgi:putative glutamine amidotransferase
MTIKRKPVVLIPADFKQIGDHPFHVVGHKYLLAVADASGALPLVVPSISNLLEIEDLLEIADGILLTGAVSNVHPSHFGQDIHDPKLPLDLARDALTLKLVKAAVEAEVPILAICRGFQVHEVLGFNDHREAKTASVDSQYGHAHSINLVADGQLSKIVGEKQMMVNSLHGQGIDRLGVGLVAEAYAPDGLIEAIHVENSKAFSLGVQWHPEWKVMENPQYLAIFKAFGDACRFRMRRHEPPD